MLPHKEQEKGTLLNSFYEVSIILTAKPDKGITRKETIDQNPSWIQTQKIYQNMNKPNSMTYKKLHVMTNLDYPNNSRLV